MKLKVTRSTGNVFRDLGFSPEEAEHLKVRSELMIHLQKAIDARGLKQAEAAKLLQVTQPRISDLVRGRVDLFSVDTLIDMLARLGIRVKLVLRPLGKRAGVALGVVIKQVHPITFVSAPGGGCSSSLRGSDGASA